MPIIKSAIKRARQNDVRRARRLPYKTRLKTVMKQVLELAEAGKKDEGLKVLPTAFKVIDTAVKKQIIHPNTAARKKSRLSRLLTAK